jgi:hypothetical protein
VAQFGALNGPFYALRHHDFMEHVFNLVELLGHLGFELLSHSSDLSLNLPEVFLVVIFLLCYPDSDISLIMAQTGQE